MQRMNAAPAPKPQNFFDFAVKINRYQRSYAHTNTRRPPPFTKSAPIRAVRG
jgi:hypothetical protein